jgi:predicted ATPase with chaperone activity
MVEYMTGEKEIIPVIPIAHDQVKRLARKFPDFSTIYGQEHAKRALTIAAA